MQERQIMGNKPSNDKFMPIFLGILMVIFGIMAILKRGFYSSKESHYIDFGQYHWVFGMAILIIGILFIVSSQKNRNHK